MLSHPPTPLRLRADPTGWGRVEAFLRLDDWIEISERGVRPSSYEKVWLPPGTIRSVTIDRWIGAGEGVQPVICATAHLTDGRMVRMPGLQRPEGWGVASGPSVSIQQCEAGSDNWIQAVHERGEPVVWNQATDRVVAQFTGALIDLHSAGHSADPAAASAVKLRGLVGYEAASPAATLPDFLRALRPGISRYRRWERQSWRS